MAEAGIETFSKGRNLLKSRSVRFRSVHPCIYYKILAAHEKAVPPKISLLNDYKL